MWNRKKSVYLSKFCILIFTCLMIGTAAAAPWLVPWFLKFSHAVLRGSQYCFFTTIYLGCIPSAILLYYLYRLLKHIESDQVFLAENVEYLRRISWSCFAGAIISFVSAFYYFPWIFLAVAAGFMGLIVRVVKNVVSQAVELKNEADFTI